MPVSLDQKKKPENFPKRGVYPKAENTVRIMSFNLLCKGNGENEMKNRTGIAAQTIAEYLPDTFGVQEATPQWMKALQRNLPEYGVVGVGRDNGHSRGEYAAVFYLKEKYDAIDYGTFWISETPDKPSKSWDSSLNRICTWAVLENKKAGEKYVHMNTHLDHIGDKAREYGVKMILEKAAGFDIPAVCTGDFNFTEDSAYYAQLTAGILRDTKTAAPDTMNCGTYHDFRPEELKNQVIDFILVNDKFTPKVYRVVTGGIGGRLVSDHFPVYADMVLGIK